MPLESGIVRRTVDKLVVIPNGYVIKKHGNQFGKSGDPDILFWKGLDSTMTIYDGGGNPLRIRQAGLSFAFETKRRGKNATKIQEVRLQRLARAAVITAVVRSVDEVRAILGSYGIEM